MSRPKETRLGKIWQKIQTMGRSSAARPFWLGLGGLLVLTGMVISPIPGPMGTPLVLAGLLIILRNSLWARRWYVRLSRRWPVTFRIPNRVLRRRRRSKSQAPEVPAE